MNSSIKTLLATTCLFMLPLLTGNFAFAVEQGELMESAPPKFMLVSNVDKDAGTITGMSTIERLDPTLVISAYYRTLKLSDVTVTNAMRKPVTEDVLDKIHGKLVVISDGRTPLSAAYLGLFRKDTFVITLKQ